MDSTTLLGLVTSGYAVLDAFDLNPLKLIGQQVSPSITGYVKRELFGDPTYRNQLATVVDTVLDQYRQEYGVTDRARVMYFFQIQWTWDRVLAYRLFQANPPLKVADLPQLAGLVIPAQAELDEFDQRIQQAMAADPELQRRFYQENHQEISVQFALAASQQLARIEARLDQQPTAIHSVLDVLEKNTLERYKPFTTLQLLQDMQPEVQRHPANTALQARFQYLLGRSYQETGDVDAAHQHYLRAYGLEGTNVPYAEQAALAYTRLGMVTEAEEVLTHLKLLSPLSPIRYAVSLFVQAETLHERLPQVPAFIAGGEVFKISLVELLLQNKAEHLEKVQTVLHHDLEAYAPATQLTFENRRFQATLAQMVVHLEFDRLPLVTQLNKVELLTDRPRLALAYQTLQRYTQLLAPTEKAPLLTHHYFVQGLAGFHLTGDIEEFAEFSRRFALLPPAEQHAYRWQWACTLFRAQCYSRVLEVLEAADPSVTPDVDYIRYHALFALDDEGAKETLQRHVEQLARIDAISFDRVLRYVSGHCRDTAERLAAVEACVARGQIELPLVECLLRAEVATLQDDAQPQLTRYLAQAESLVDEDTPAVFRQHLASLYQHVDNYGRAAELLEGAEGVPGPAHPGIELIRLRNQYHLFQNSGQLYEALRAWRLEHGKHLEFCSWEVELAYLLLDWERIVEVTGALKDSVSAQTGARWAYLRALYKLDRSQELRAALQEIAQRPDLLTHDQLLAAAGMAFHEGHADVALALCFPLALNPENVAARTRFFALFTQDDRPRTQPEEIGPGTAVWYVLGNKRPRRLFLTAELLASGANPIATQLVGKRAGDTVDVVRGVRQKRVPVHVLEVTDLHTGLWREIQEEIRQNESALPFESISFGSDNPTLEDINRTLLEVLGEGERSRQQAVQQLLVEYRCYEASFFQVAVHLHNGNFLEAYHHLTSGREDVSGLVVLPATVFPAVPELPERPIVLDWSSLPLMYALSTQHEMVLPSSLWVSRLVVEDLREQVQEKRRSKPVELSVEIIDEQVRPHFYPPEMHARQLAYLEDLLAWVETHCQTRFVPEKLDMLRQGGFDTERQKLLVNYVVDTAFLAAADGAVLVSDDTLMLETAAKGGAGVLSTEVFLQQRYPSQFKAQLLPILLTRSYLGLTVSAQLFLQEFRAASFAVEGRAQQVLRNMMQRVLIAPEYWQELAHLVRELLTMPSLAAKQRRYFATRILTAGLCYTQLDEPTQRHVVTCLAQAFWLLPTYGEEVIDCLHTAWRLAVNAQRKHRKG